MPRAGDGGGVEGGLGVYRHLTQAGFAHKGGGPRRGGLGGQGIYRHLTQGRLSTQGLRSVAVGFLCRGSFMRNHGAAAVGTLNGT